MKYELTKENFAEVSAIICKAFAEGKKIIGTNNNTDIKSEFDINNHLYLHLKINHTYEIIEDEYEQWSMADYPDFIDKLFVSKGLEPIVLKITAFDKLGVWFVDDDTYQTYQELFDRYEQYNAPEPNTPAGRKV